VLKIDVTTRIRIVGSAQKNTQPIIDALGPYIEKSLDPANSQNGASERHSVTRPERGHGVRPKILELASGTGEHLAAYAMEWTGVDWVGSERGYVSEFCLARTRLAL
jgi:hypothetical protein